MLFLGPVIPFWAYFGPILGLYDTLWGGGYFRVILPYWTSSEGILGVLLGFIGPNLTILAI